jgi:predicted MPP superfamily phosphohydrolase
MRGIFFPVLILSLLIGMEYYMFQCLKLIFPPKDGARFSVFLISYLVFSIGLYVVFFSYRLFGMHGQHKVFFEAIVTMLLMMIVAKLIVFIFMFVGDIVRMIRAAISQVSLSPEVVAKEAGMTRSSFLAKVAISTAAIPFFSILYGVVVNAYNYQYRKLTIKFPNLPEEFDGFRLVQISDIHSGSFTRTEPLIHAVEAINKMDADIILFTGDLVNNEADEMIPYKEIFSRLRSKHGVLSTTGNHDYGDYSHWPTPEAKKENFKRFMNTHKEMGWDLLMNENRILERNGQKIAIIGIENWGQALHFPKYGRLDVAYKGTENIPFKILMSHDPSHWDAQVRPEYPAIDLALAGHTHGFQFGIENKYIKWSPSEWVYKQWAGLYQEGKQYIYVNRGFGFLGYPGRVGILPEVTEITLRKG